MSRTYFKPPLCQIIPFPAGLSGRGKAKGNLRLEFFPCDYSANNPVWQKIRDEIVIVSRETYRGRVVGVPPGHWNEKVEKYLLAGDEARMGVAWDNDTMVGFSALKRLTINSVPTLYVILSLVSPQYQGVGISTYILARLTYDLLVNHPSKESYFSVETPNPVVFGKMTKVLLNVHPNPYRCGANPLPEIRQLADAMAKKMYSGHEFDLEEFVVRDWYLESPSLLYRAGCVPQYSNQKINEFCEQRLRSNRERGDKFLIIGKASLERANMILSLFSSGQRE